MSTQKHSINRGRARMAVPAACAMALLVCGGAVRATTGATTRLSVDSAGGQANGNSSNAAISADGRFVAFDSRGSNLVANDTNGRSDVFVHDRESGQITRISVASGGAEGNGDSLLPAISADGRFVAFASSASNFVAGDTNLHSDVFVHDRETGETTRVSVDSAGAQGLFSSNPAISADGRFVAFESNSSNLVGGDTNSTFDVFVHDRESGETTRVSVGSGGTEGNGDSVVPSISADGRLVAFMSLASNLVAGDTNFEADVFVHDRETGQTTRASVNSGGIQGNRKSDHPSISADGRIVAFMSFASNLVSLDTNGTVDVFAHDRESGQTTRVSVGSGGTQANSASQSVGTTLSGDGRFVTFFSHASNLVANDTNSTYDVFVHDRESGQTTRVSTDTAGMQANDQSAVPAITVDGRFVAFMSLASNLVSDDTNGVWDVFVHDREPLLADTTPPVLTLPSNITVNANAATGAVVTYIATATDNVDPAPVLSCVPASGSLFRIGTTTVVCTATDASGNSTSGNFTVTVKSAAAQIADVITYVTMLNASQGVVNSLDAKLQNILAALDAANAGQLASACSKLDAFINEVQAQAGKSITQADAVGLIGDAQRIKAVIGCT